jgi:hypothetical protein
MDMNNLQGGLCYFEQTIAHKRGKRQYYVPPFAFFPLAEP